MARRQHNRIDEELVVADALARHLRDDLGQSVTINREHNDPPDFWATIDGRRYAVEITSLTDAADLARGADLDALRLEVKQAVMTGSIGGTYALRSSRAPAIPKPRSIERRELVARLASFVRDTQGSETASDQVISGRLGSLSIHRLGSNGATVGAMRSVGVWRQAAAERLAEWMSDQLGRKRERLHALTEAGIPVILAFYDADAECDAEEVEHALRVAGGFDWCAAVFVARSYRTGENTIDARQPMGRGRFLHDARES